MRMNVFIYTYDIYEMMNVFHICVHICMKNITFLTICHLYHFYMGFVKVARTTRPWTYISGFQGLRKMGSSSVQLPIEVRRDILDTQFDRGCLWSPITRGCLESISRGQFSLSLSCKRNSTEWRDEERKQGFYNFINSTDLSIIWIFFFGGFFGTKSRPPVTYFINFFFLK